MKPRVVVTGVGAVTAWGAGATSLWQGLLSGRSAIAAFTRFDAARHRTHLAAEVPVPLGIERGARAGERARHASLSDRFALAAAREALTHASLDVVAGAETGVYFGSSTGGMWESERYYARLLRVVPGRPRIAELASQQYNAPGDAVARELGAGGPVTTLSSACTSGALAIAEAREALLDGEVELAVAGGSDSLCQLTYAGFNSLRAVDPGGCRPFRAGRAGMALGEGAAALVLETLEHARGRGAEPLAELLAAASTCDAHHMTAPSPAGEGAARAIARALAEAAVEPAAVDFVNAHGTGTPLNDAAEWQALRAAFGARAAELPVTAPKGSIGHLLGAAGAVEAVATVLGLRHGVVPPTAGDGEVDPEAPVSLVTGAPLELPLALGLSINLAFGGSNAALLFRRWEPA